MTDKDRSIPDSFVEALEKGTNDVLRIGQYLYILQSWCQQEKGMNDIFNLENYELVNLMNEYNETQRFSIGCSV